MGIPLEEMVVWDPWAIQVVQARAADQTQPRRQRILCGKALRGPSALSASHIDQVRAKYPGIQVIVHPECRWEVCLKADALGSTDGSSLWSSRLRRSDVCRRH